MCGTCEKSAKECELVHFDVEYGFTLEKFIAVCNDIDEKHRNGTLHVEISPSELGWDPSSDDEYDDEYDSDYDNEYNCDCYGDDH